MNIADSERKIETDFLGHYEKSKDQRFQPAVSSFDP